MAPQDAFLDDAFMDEDDSCPLCVEEFDITDKGFKPCPCGYRICSFCYHNIRNNMNGLCPACRRPYDDKNIEWKVVSPEEYKAQVQAQAKKKAQARQKEVQKREAESQSRKHLSGLRVVQKNLVYVVGLTPRIREDELLQTLRGEQFFGQYGKIVKIVVSKPREGSHANQPMGVYVTFARKEDAAKCIQAVDGSENGGRTLRAQYGTTKYCSAYLRNEPCPNRNCMFLHEPGDENESFTRQDLSSINSVSTQRLAQPTTGTSSSASNTQQGSSSNQPPQPQPPVQQTPHPMAAATHSMSRQSSKEGTVDSGDGSALPSTASWAHRGLQQSRRSSQAASMATASPRPANATVSTSQQSEQHDSQVSSQTRSEPSASPLTQATSQPPSQSSQPIPAVLLELLRALSIRWTPFEFNDLMFTPEELQELENYLPMWDDNGGIKRRMVRDEDEEAQRQSEEESRIALQAASDTLADENPEAGSLQLGGEPEARSEGRMSRQGVDQQQAIQPPSFSSFGQGNALVNNLTRGLTPAQQQQMLLLKPDSPQPTNFLDQLSQQQQSGIIQNSNQQLASQGHIRQASRYTFANDSPSASAAVKPAANAKLMAQQSAMMPPTSHQNSQHQFYTGTIHGPPPGLKSTGTPPVGGAGVFGQGHGFGSSQALNTKENNEELMRNLLRGRSAGSSGGNQAGETGKREFNFPFLQHQYPSASTPAPAPGFMSSLYGPQSGIYQDSGLQKQKKKGKKHRHANTSSSGGGGVVDLADPSILQARLQQQGGPGVGQGLFGGQGQDDIDLDPRLFVPESIQRADSRPISTPPGLPIPSHSVTQPPLQVSEEPALELASKGTHPHSVIQPSLPAVPVSHGQLLTKEKLGESKKQATDKQAAESSKSNKQGADSNAQKEDQANQVSTEEAFMKAQAQAMRIEAENVQSSTETIRDAKKTDQEVDPVNKKGLRDTPEPEPERAEREKRQPPGKLDIAAAKDASFKSIPPSTISTPVKSDTPVKELRSGLIAPGPASRPGTPGTPSKTGDGSFSRTQHRVLRVVDTPKEDSGPSVTSIAPATQPASGLPSRQPSVASIARPATPGFEGISDNASITSNSLSRTSSPPPSKVGTAPVRAKTKSQLKKERQERAKAADESKLIEEPVKPSVEEPVHEPIVGRKKKQKKSAPIGTTTSTPAGSRPESPTVEESNKVTEKTMAQPIAAPIETKKTGKKGRGRKTAPEPSPVTSPSPKEADDGIDVGAIASSVFQELSEELGIHPSKWAIFNTPPGLNHRWNFTKEEIEQYPNKHVLDKDQQAQFGRGESVHVDGIAGKASLLVTPKNDWFVNLSPEEEKRMDNIQKHLDNMSNLLKFHSNLSSKDNDASSGAPSKPATVTPPYVFADTADPVTGNWKYDSVVPVSHNPSMDKFSTTPGMTDPFNTQFGAGIGSVTPPSTKSIEEIEKELIAAKKEFELINKKFDQLQKKNKKMFEQYFPKY